MTDPTHDSTRSRRIGPFAAVAGGVVAVLVAVLVAWVSGQHGGAHFVGYLVAALAGFNGLRTAVAGAASRPWVNRIAGSVAVLLAALAAVVVYAGVHAVAL